MGLTLDSTIGELLSNQKVEAYFVENIPEVTNHPNLEVAKTMPFSTVAQMAADRISSDVVAKLDTFLQTL